MTYFLCEVPMAIDPFYSREGQDEESSQLRKHRNQGNAALPSLQEYCKFKNTEDSAFPSVYIGLKDKLSGIRKVITDSTVHLVQLLHNYKEKLQEFAKDGEKLPVGCGVCLSEWLVGKVRERARGGGEIRGTSHFPSHPLARLRS